MNTATSTNTTSSPDYALNQETQTNQEEFSQFDTQKELWLISMILKGGSIPREVVSAIAPPMFYSGAYRMIYEACLQVHQGRQPVNLVSVPQQLVKNGHFEKIGMPLLKKIQNTFSPVDEAGLVKVIRDKYFRRQIMIFAQNFYQQAQDPRVDTGDIIAAFSEGTKLISKAYKDPSTADCQQMYLGKVYDLLIQDVAKGGFDSEKVALGYSTLDEMMKGGIEKTDVIYIAGRTSMGKSILACDMAYNHNVIHQKPVIYFTFESSIKQIGKRIMSRDLVKNSSNHPMLEKLSTGNLAGEEWMELYNLHLNAGKIKIASAHGNFNLIGEIIEQTLEENNGELGMVVIDYLQLMELGDEGDSQLVNLTPGKRKSMMGNRTAELSWISRQLKHMAGYYEIPFVVAAQINRGVESRNDKRPLLSDIKDTGGAEQDADVVMLLYRDEYYNPQTSDRGVIEVNLAKARNGGETGTTKFLFDPQYSRLRPIYS